MIQFFIGMHHVYKNNAVCRVDVGVYRMNRINRTNGINGRMKAIASKHYLVMEMYQ